MTLTETVLAAILGLARAPAVDAVLERPRLEAFAASIAAAAERVPTRLSVEDSALALVAIAHHESAFSARVADCRITGDTGRSITAFQLLRGPAWGGFTRAELCASPERAAERALAVLAQNGARSSTPLGLFAGYAGLAKGKPTKAARDICASWERLVKRPGACGMRLRRAS